MNKSTELLNSVKNYKYIILIGIILGIVSIFLSKEIISPFIIVFLGLGIGIFFVSLNKDQEDCNFLSTLFIFAFLSRIMSSFLLFGLNILLKKGKGLFGDGWCYSENGYLILQMWLNKTKDFSAIVMEMYKRSVSGTLDIYDFWNAFVYFFTGKSPLSLVFINCLAGSLTVIVIYYITKQFSSKKAAVYASFLTAFWPSTFLWSIQNLKEPIAILLITILIWSFVRLSREFRFYLVFFIIASTIALKNFRAVSFYILYLIVLPLSFLLMLWKEHKVKAIFFVLALCFSALLFLELVRTNIINLPFYSLHLSDSASILKWAYQMRTYRVLDANSAFLVNLNFTKPLGLIIFTPLALLFSWFAPFPWQLGSMLQIMAIPEMLIFYLLIPFMFSGIVFAMKNKFNESVIIVVYIFVMFFVLAFLEGNVGTLFRHRALILPFIFVLVGIGISQNKVKKISL